MPMNFRLDRKICRTVRGFSDDDQNEGYAESAALSPEERVELVGILHKQHIRFVLNLPDFPPMDRKAVRVVDPRKADE